jgi:hypothetical protein
MNRKLILTVALASAFAVTMSAAYAEGDEDKKSDSQLILSEGDEKQPSKPELIAEGDEDKKSDSQLILSEGDEKQPSKPELVG